MDEVRLKNGKITRLYQEEIMKCPFRIMLPEHYLGDGTCRCTDRDHTDMIGWGYVWHGGRWNANEEPEV